MELVEVGGKKMLQVVVNDWNSIVDVPEFKLNDGVKAFAEFKYVVAQEEYTAAQINATVQLIDTINLMKPSWSNDSIASTTGIVQSNPNGEFVRGSANITATMKVAHQVQFFGQQNVSWGAVIGDTMWVGAVRAYEVDPLVIVDPATFNPSNLASGWEIVDIDGEKYFKVSLTGGWPALTIPEYTLPEGVTAFKCTAKLDPGTSGFEVDQVNTFLKIATSSWTEIEAAGIKSTAEFSEFVVPIEDPTIGDGKVGVFQTAGQETVGWTTISGATLYISKVEAVLAPTAAAVTFIVDDSSGKTYDGFMLKGSWFTATGEYDNAWDGGVEHTAFYDDGTHGDATAGDNIWSVTVELVPDGGTNTWEWGFNDLSGNWVPKNNTQFTVVDASPVTTTYEIKTGVDEFAKNAMKVYPNPTSGIINISGIDTKAVEIFNMYGAKVLSVEAKSNAIDVSGLSNGAYLVKAIATNGEIKIGMFNKK